MSTAPKPFLQVQNLSKRYGEQQVLENINLSVQAGEFVSIVGASGCGKTTFLRILLGAEAASSGKIFLAGQPLNDEPDQQRGIVFQRYSVFPHLTVEENVLLGLELQQAPLWGKLFGRKRQQARAESQKLLASVGLENTFRHYPQELSGGMQQRLAIAQALITHPKILLLDEPFGALDPGVKANIHILIKRLWREHRITIFMVTHDIKEGFQLATRLIVFDKVRLDPQAPKAFGAKITYDLLLKGELPVSTEQLTQQMQKTEQFLEKNA